jgi:hypothetical protein
MNRPHSKRWASFKRNNRAFTQLNNKQTVEPPHLKKKTSFTKIKKKPSAQLKNE